tara:strand:- start:1051 stop:1218 length:168 start_codon:yes stop_codon:yes gene_type:complete
MNKARFENLMIVIIAAILLIVSFLNKEEYSPISLIPLIFLFLSGKLFYKEKRSKA